MPSNEPSRDFDSWLGLEADWRNHTDWPSRILERLREALQVNDTERLAQFAGHAEELIAYEHPEIAAAICQILFLKMRGPGGGISKGGRASIPDIVNALIDFQATDDKLSACVMKLAGSLAASAQMYAQAGDLNRRAADILDHLGERTLSAEAHLGTAQARLAEGRWELAGQAAAQASKRFALSGDPHEETRALIIHVQALLALGELAEGEDLVSRAIELLPRLRSAEVRAVTKRTQARLQIERGEYVDAHTNLRVALRISRRTGDAYLESLILQDLAILTETTKGAKPAAAWWAKALNRAEGAISPSRELEIARGAGLNALENDRPSVGADILKRALERHTETRPHPIYEQVQADWSAMMLNRLAQDLEQGGWRTAEPQLAEVEGTLDEAICAFVEWHDAEWAGIAAKNQKLVGRLRDRQCDVATRLREVANQSDHREVVQAVLAEAALLGVGCLASENWASEWLLSVGQGKHDESWVMHVAKEAETLDQGDVLQDTDRAIRLLEIACAVAGRQGHWAYGDLVNDLGVKLANAGRAEEAIGSFELALRIAQEHDNRVLASLTLGNLAELNVRAGESDRARSLFRRSAELAEQVGDSDKAIHSWSAILRSGLAEDTEDVAEVTKKLTDLETGGVSPDARAAVLSAQAAAAYRRAAFGKASALWARAANHDQDHLGERLALSLDARARTGNRSRFELQLERAVARLGRDSQTLDFSKKLLGAAQIWMETADADATALTLAVSTALAAATLSTSKTSDDPQSLYFQSISTLVAVQLTIESIQDQAARPLLTLLDRHLREMVGEDGAESIYNVMEWVKDQFSSGLKAGSAPTGPDSSAGPAAEGRRLPYHA